MWGLTGGNPRKGKSASTRSGGEALRVTSGTPIRIILVKGPEICAVPPIHPANLREVKTVSRGTLASRTFGQVSCVEAS